MSDSTCHPISDNSSSFDSQGSSLEKELLSKIANSVRNAREYGAVGDGIANDTKAIQSALDAGGVVFLPKGTYVCGTLHLRSNGGLRLDEGAKIIGSHDTSDYNALEYCPQNEAFPQESVSGRHLISAVEVENIILEGGTIDGDGRFWTLGPWPNRHLLTPSPERPGQMVFIVECKNVVVRNIKMMNASYWHCLLHGCENVVVHHLTVRGDSLIINSDSLDLDSCSHARVWDCDLQSGDDALTLRASTGRLRHSHVCEDVMIKNCRLRSEYATGMRIGVGDGLIRNCEVTGLDIIHCKTGFSMVAKWSDKEGNAGVSIQGLRIADVKLHSMRPFIITLDHRYNAPIKHHASSIYDNICFENISGTGELSNYIEGNGIGEIRNFLFKNVELTYGGVGKAPFLNSDGMWCADSDDSIFAMCHAKNIRFENVKLISNGKWSAEIRRDDTAEVEISDPNWRVICVDKYQPHLGFEKKRA